MKTLFSLGLPGSFDFWNPPAPAALGQADVPVGSLTEAQHADILARLKSAMAKVKDMDDWIHTIGDQQATILGDSYADFRLDIDFLAGLYTDVYPDYQRIDTTNIEEWWIPDFDGWKVGKFLSTTDHAYKIFTQKVNGVYPQTPVVNAVPVAPGTRPASPLPATARPASTGILPPPKVLGIPTNTLLIGGGVAVGLGVLFYALR